MSTPIVSVIVPIYNVEAYLPRCVDSILAQTFTDFELFLVDDGSPDNCGAMCDDYAAKDSRITVIHKENGGLSDARNAALDVARGDYITFIDSDDWVVPNHLESMLQTLTAYQADVVVCNLLRAYERGEEEPLYTPSAEPRLLAGNEKYDIFLQPSACNKLYKAVIFKTLRYPVGKLYEDAFVCHKMLALANRVAYTGEATYMYFFRDGSIMRTEYTPRFMDIVEAMYERTLAMEEAGLADRAADTRLYVYSQVAVAYAHVVRKDVAAYARLKEVRAMYDACYPAMIKEPSYSAKQKFRIWLLKYIPWLHTQLFGKRMPINLGG